MRTTICIGLVFAASRALFAAEFKSHEEPFESLDGITAYVGYKAASADLHVVAEGAKEGTKCVKAAWVAKPDSPGNGGIEKTFPATDFTGKSFSVWIQSLTTDTVGSVFVSFHDASDKRAEMRAWHGITDWKKLVIPVGAKGNAHHYEKDATADLTQITTVRFYALTQQGGQKAETLWDGFREEKN